MRKLRLLQLSYVNIKGSYAHFSKDLRWLGFSSEYFPTNFSLRSLVVMDMQYSNLKLLWEAREHPQLANMLKYLNLSHSAYLLETPDFSYCPNLEKLVLVNCKSLVQIHKSIGILHQKLLLVNLTGCEELHGLPTELYKLKSLETLILSGCLKLERLDDALGELESLTTLDADFTALREIPYSINQLKKLKKLSLKGCKGSLRGNDNIHFEKGTSVGLLLPNSINSLSCLRILCLAYCNLSDELIPKDLGSLSILEHLDLRGNNFRRFQTDLASLPKLRFLGLSDCSELEFILSLPRSLIDFYAEKCIALERTPDLSECPSLERLYLSDCINLVETSGIHNHKKLFDIKMERCKLGTYNTGETLLKGWVERNHKCICLPGYNNLPNWISFKEEMRSFSFTVPETPKSEPAVGFTLWTRFVGGVDVFSTLVRAMTVKNQTRGGAWIHSLLKSKPWQSNVWTEDFHMETGDQMEVDVDCDESITIMETGFSLAYNARESSEFNFGNIKFTHKVDNLRYYGDDVMLFCLREKSDKHLLRTMVYAPIEDRPGQIFYGCSVFPEIPRNKFLRKL